jgi:hypothetical protein
MLLRGPHASIELLIEGYQFPSEQRHFEDANWLVIAGTVEAATQKRRFRDAALMTFEVERLAAWLNDVAADRHPRWREQGFIEPLFTFRQLRPDSFDLSLTLSHEAAPVVVFDEELQLELTPTRQELEAAARDLRSDLTGFPVRGTEEFALEPDEAAAGLQEWRAFLVQAVQWMAAPSEAQLAALPDSSFLIDEMVLTFTGELEEARRLASASERLVFDGEAAGSLDRLEALVAALPTNGSSGLWSPPALSQAAEWERVRTGARSVLTALGQPRRDAELRHLPAVGKSHWS